MKMSSREYPQRPIVGVGAVILHENSVLLVKRGKPPRNEEWSLPGGAQRVGEPILDALCREVKEETGLDVSICSLIDVIDGIFHDTEGKTQFHYTLIDYLAIPTSHELRAGSDAAEVKWFALDELGEIEIWSETRRIITTAASLNA